jgi:hypothetical protein
VQPSSEPTRGGAGAGRKKKNKAFDIAFEQYQVLKDKLDGTGDVREKNLIFRRLLNLLDVMQFLHAHNRLSQ